VAAVTNESRFLSDLHLNSITVGQLVAEAAKRLHLPPLVSLTDFANGTPGQVAQALEELASTGATEAAEGKQRAPSGVDSWVRPFTIEWVERPLPTRPTGADRGAGDWQMIAPPSHPLLAALQKLLAETNGEGVVVCLPAQPDQRHMPLLLQGAHAVLAKKRSPRFVLVQHGWGAGGFARTLHLECPEITTCVVDVPFGCPEAANWVRQEALAARGYGEARYDMRGVRREPRLQLLPLPEQPGELPLGPDDVLLVTGGGKGIAAECALALGRKSKARLVLLGRSLPSADAELASNLARAVAAGLRCRYLAVDVTDAEAVRKAVAQAEGELGKVTAFLHGAGTNVPQLIGTLDEAAFQRTLSPKIQGARNVLTAIDPERLRLFITFGSIIARTGLPGEADYAVANEWLTNLTEEFQAAHPNCRCLAAEWSVWSGLGMGQRLGRIESLRQQGITPIPSETGIAMLEQLLRHPLPSVAIVITGRFGELPTLKLEMPDLPFLRFLEQPKVFYPGVELIVDSVLSSDTDPYVEDHVLHGERLFPAIMGLEAMAQTAMALADSDGPPSFENVKLVRPVVVPRSGKVTIRVAALLQRPGVVEVALRSEESGFQVDHFGATCCFKTKDRRSRREEALFNSELRTPNSELEVSPLVSAGTFERLKLDHVPLEPVRDLYEELLFHTGRFRRVRSYRLLRAKECLVQVDPDADAVWFGRYLPQDRLLGDPGVRDAAIHAIQACIPHARLLPVGVRRIVIGKIPCLLDRVRTIGRIPELLLHARQQSRDGDTFYYDLELLGEDGSVLEKWEGLCLRKVEELPRQTPWREALLGPYVERRLEELILGSRIAVVLQRGGPGDRSERSDAAIHDLLGDCVKIRRRSDGRPEVDGDSSVSTAHAGELTFGVAGPALIGCDLEPVSARPPGTWQDLLGRERFSLAERMSKDTAEDFDVAATRVWTALECLKKADAAADAPLLLEAAKENGWVLLSSGKRIIATYPAHVRDVPNRLVLAVLVTVQSSKLKVQSSS
jgi:enediyne polyketide synthase